LSAEDRLGRLTAAGAEETGEAHDLAGAHVEGDVVENVAAGQAPHPEHGFTLYVAVLPEAGGVAFDLGELAAEHGGYELELREVGQVAGMDQLAVAQHRYLLADLVELVEVVANVDDADVLVAQLPDDLEELLHLARLEGGGRLVHDDHPGVERDGPGDRDHLLGPEPQRVQRHSHVGLDTVAAQDLGGLPVHPVDVEQPEPRAGLAAEKDVLRDRAHRYQVDLLVYSAYPRRLGVARAGERDLLSAEEDLALVRLVDAGYDLDQGGLARAVLPDERVHLTGW
jgi:hypothetical protein